jgi:EAL domain-containing protein (putative c-di-GMP-specific phosphodiesterase class I)
MRQESDAGKLAMERALQEGQIIPYFQPLVNLRTNSLLGFEILARRKHPAWGLLTPNYFLPLMEKTKLIGQLTETLLVQATAAAAAWPGVLRIAINVHPYQLQERALPEMLYSVAQRNAFPLSLIVLEVTERADVENMTIVRSVVKEIKDFGVRLALDDFGAGYSRLRCLYELSFDELKIDASFIHMAPRDRKSRAIVSAIVELGRRLGLTTTAEGIENQTQAEMSRDLGCDLGQGWYFGKAVPEDKITAFLASGDMRGFCEDAEMRAQKSRLHLAAKGPTT